MKLILHTNRHEICQHIYGPQFLRPEDYLQKMLFATSCAYTIFTQGGAKEVHWAQRQLSS